MMNQGFDGWFYGFVGNSTDTGRTSNTTLV
jgi:hypothetical protein